MARTRTFHRMTTPTRRCALVCGASEGIGRATAEVLASRGDRVLVLARREDRLKAVVAGLAGSGHAAVVADLSHPTQFGEIAATLTATHGPIHILVNNAGGPPGGPLLDASTGALSDAFAVHVQSPHVLVQALVPGMKEAGWGRIVNVISTSVKQPIPGLGVSNTVRAATANWAKTLAGELAPHGITVNNVLPGATLTSRLEALAESRATQSGKRVEEVLDDMRDVIPAGRFARPEETARTIAFLASDDAGYITGVNLPVDGGRTGSL